MRTAVVAVFGKTEGNGLVNDFSRGFATRALQDALRAHREDGDADEPCIVMSGGTEGALAPHFLVFEARDSDEPERRARWRSGARARRRCPMSISVASRRSMRWRPAYAPRSTTRASKRPTKSTSCRSSVRC